MPRPKAAPHKAIRANASRKAIPPTTCFSPPGTPETPEKARPQRSVLKNLFSASKSPKHDANGPETGPVKMNLDERMAFRREMLFEAIRVTMQSHGILSASYKFRVVRNDKRGHQYLVLVDLSTDFLDNREGRPARLVEVGAAI